MNKVEIVAELVLLKEEGEQILKTKWSPADSGIISFNTYVDFDAYISWKKNYSVS